MTASDGQEPVSIDRISDVHHDDKNVNLELTKTDYQGSHNVHELNGNTERETIGSNHVNVAAIDLDSKMSMNRTTEYELVVPSEATSQESEKVGSDQINAASVQPELAPTTFTAGNNVHESNGNEHLCENREITISDTDGNINIVSREFINLDNSKNKELIGSSNEAKDHICSEQVLRRLPICDDEYMNDLHVQCSEVSFTVDNSDCCTVSSESKNDENGTYCPESNTIDNSKLLYEEERHVQCPEVRFAVGNRDYTASSESGNDEIGTYCLELNTMDNPVWLSEEERLVQCLEVRFAVDNGDCCTASSKSEIDDIGSYWPELNNRNNAALLLDETNDDLLLDKSSCTVNIELESNIGFKKRNIGFNANTSDEDVDIPLLSAEAAVRVHSVADPHQHQINQREPHAMNAIYKFDSTEGYVHPIIIVAEQMNQQISPKVPGGYIHAIASSGCSCDQTASDDLVQQEHHLKYHRIEKMRTTLETCKQLLNVTWCYMYMLILNLFLHCRNTQGKCNCSDFQNGRDTSTNMRKQFLELFHGARNATTPDTRYFYLSPSYKIQGHTFLQNKICRKYIMHSTCKLNFFILQVEEDFKHVDGG